MTQWLSAPVSDGPTPVTPTNGNFPVRRLPLEQGSGLPLLPAFQFKLPPHPAVHLSLDALFNTAALEITIHAPGEQHVVLAAVDKLLPTPHHGSVPLSFVPLLGLVPDLLQSLRGRDKLRLGIDARRDHTTTDTDLPWLHWRSWPVHDPVAAIGAIRLDIVGEVGRAERHTEHHFTVFRIERIDHLHRRKLP